MDSVREKASCVRKICQWSTSTACDGCY